MKRTILYTFGLAVFLSSTACSDFLEREPKLDQSTNIVLSTYEGLRDATFGAYANLASTGWYGQDWVLTAEMRSGNGNKSRYKDSGRLIQAYTWNYLETSTSGMWSYCYSTVAMVNDVIDNLEGKETNTVTAQDLNNLKAECLFLRAFSHFCNVLTYGMPYTYCKAHDKESLGVPYIYHRDPNGKPERETVMSNYDNIVKDLLEAEKIIDPAYVHEGTADPACTANLYAIQALLSRVYLYMGEWQKSADYATKVINSGKYKMWTAKEYPDVWKAEAGTGEVIFEVYGKRTNSGYGSWNDISYMVDPDGNYGDAQTAKPLLDLYNEAGDVRKAVYKTDAKKESGLYWTGKYPGKGDFDAPDCNNVIIFRLSEMYLNRAEALQKGAKIAGTTAEKDLGTVRENRGLKAVAAPTDRMIKDERRRELAWEGHHLYDLARWDEGVTRTEADYPLCTINTNVPKPSQSKKWALPIPKRELDLNDNLVQNKE